MSRIGKKPVAIPNGVELNIKDRLVAVKGPKGELSWAYPEKVDITVEEGRALVKRADDSKQCRALFRVTF